jgi:integrase
MAWLRHVPPSARHPRDRWQVRYRDDADQERSAGIYPTQAAANAVKRRLDRGESIQSIRGLAEETGDQRKPLTLFGDYVTTTWWPRWRDGHPHSAYLYGKRIEKRILPAFGNLRFVDLDAELIGDWKAKMIAEELAPHTINAYLSLLSTILNAAVDSDYLPRSPMRRKSQAGRAEAVKKEREPRREVWLTKDQLDRVAAAITPRYRALVLAAALTGLRWGELTALRWDDLQLERAFDDGAVAGPGRLRVLRALSDPGNSGGIRVKGPKTEAGRRTIALDQETVDAFLAHRQLVGDGGYVFTTPGGSQGPGGPLSRSNFWRVWNRALKDAKLHTLWQEHGGLHFHDLRHTHATWLLACRVPLIAVAHRLGHANPVITMMVYAHVDRLVERGELTADDLGLERDDRSNTQE